MIHNFQDRILYAPKATGLAEDADISASALEVSVTLNRGRIPNTVTITTNRRGSNRAIVALPVILAGFILMGLVSACSSANPASPDTSQGGGGTALSTQASASSNPGPAANSSPGGSAQAAGASSSPAPAAPPAQEHLIGVGSETVVTIHGTIVSVNRPKKLVTLEGPNGKQVTLQVYNPYNLAAAKPGGRFVAKFYEIATVRKLMPGESMPPASLAQGIISATPGQTPSAVAGTRMQLTVTVDAIDKHKATITVQGPDGAAETVSVANPANLKYLKVGEKIVITLSKVVAIALETESGE
jgi:hypothetical protein